MQLELTEIAPTGEAIGRHEGMVIFVPCALPGELVEIELVHRRRTFARARLVKVIRPSMERITPPCPYFGLCGGCEWQHVGIAQQRAYKTQAVKEQFTRIARLSDVEVQPCLGTDQPYHYRNHTQVVVSPHERPGFNMAGTNNVVEIDACPITDDRLNDLLAAKDGAKSAFEQAIQQAKAHGILRRLREVHLRAGAGPHERMIVLEEQDGRSSVAYGQPSLHERVGEFEYTISPASFFQVNTGIAELLVREVLASLSLTGAERVLDLYCGAGLFSLPLSTRAGVVLGVESNPVAIRDARLNLLAHPNARFIVADVAEALVQDEIKATSWDAALLDPPRAGAAYEALQRLLALRVPRVTYVSCDPATLARDVRVCVDNGYTIKRIQPFDMFPQTHHVETVVSMELVPHHQQ
jgi:23S rRNA (uracil1939-C5)-methyltransferase